ncbi:MULTISPECIES: sce7726 family protein [Serratia]|nr:sce7726 family protein [Serratia marcescens]MBH2604437.1 sce7726 family protein [Serratia marcescens]MBN5394104.1 sce7726 family protein [Serratia marcescens]QIX79715.1 sce7726 family protein [Serratia marcescens]HDT6551080.1 sce7726 family protein [Serratia marcescens]
MINHKNVGQLFTSQTINAVADGDFSLLHQLAAASLPPKLFPIKISDFFDIAFKKLSNEYKSEYFFKNIIANEVFLKKHKRNKAVMLSEFRVGANKADCVILNGLSTCYEIKTELDNLKRLPEQLEAYICLFDKVYVVSAKSHVEKVKAIIPEVVGVMELTQKNKLEEVKPALIIESEINPKLMISSMRIAEFKSMAEKISGEPIDLPNMDVYSFCLDIFERASSCALRGHFRETLKEHRANDFSFIDTLPRSLKSSAISYSITQSRQRSLTKILSSYIEKDDICTSLY